MEGILESPVEMRGPSSILADPQVKVMVIKVEENLKLRNMLLPNGIAPANVGDDKVIVEYITLIGYLDEWEECREQALSPQQHVTSFLEIVDADRDHDDYDTMPGSRVNWNPANRVFPMLGSQSSS